MDLPIIYRINLTKCEILKKKRECELKCEKFPFLSELPSYTS